MACQTSHFNGNVKYNIDYYLELAHELQAMGVHSIAIKDMAGLLTPRAAKMLGEWSPRHSSW